MEKRRDGKRGQKMKKEKKEFLRKSFEVLGVY